VQGNEVFVPELIRFVDDRVRRRAHRTRDHPERPGYVLLVPGLRRFELVRAGAGDAPRATWAFVSQSARTGRSGFFCSAWRKLRDAPDDSQILRRASQSC